MSFWREHYNTLMCLAGAAVLGISAGVVGSFMLLRKRSLVGDVVGHAALPGVCIAFLVMELVSPGSGKYVPGLLVGAGLAGALGVLGALAVRHLTRVREDAALAIVLGVFYGAGIVLLSVVQKVSERPDAGSPAGLKNYIFGMASAIDLPDVVLMAAAGLLAIVVCGALFKELTLLCFDEEFAAIQGWPVGWLDVLLMGLVVLVAVVGMPSAGLLLVVAMLIVPAAAARFWTDDLRRMTWVAGAAGCIGAALAVVASASYQLPTGPLIVLAGSAFFVVSLLFGTRRGALRRWLTHWMLRRRIGRHDLLRAMYEIVEQSLPAGAVQVEATLAQGVPIERLLAKRSWTPWRLGWLIASAERTGLVRRNGGTVAGTLHVPFAEDGTRNAPATSLAPSNDNALHLTAAGLAEARQIIRNHRLWEMYLITYADVAPSHVDRSADRIEHVLDAELILELENRLAEHHPQVQLPPSPHLIGLGERGA